MLMYVEPLKDPSPITVWMLWLPARLLSRIISFIYVGWIVRLARLNIARKLQFFMIVVVCWIDQFKIWYYALYHDASLATMISWEHLHDIVTLWQVIAICQGLLLFHWRYNYPSYALLLHGRAILKLSVSCYRCCYRKSPTLSTDILTTGRNCSYCTRSTVIYLYYSTGSALYY